MIDLTLMDRLKVLNFDEEFRRNIKMRPMSRYYFLVESNPVEQFHVFTSLAVWLCQRCGLSDMQPPLEDEDPNSTLTGILDAARSLGIPVDFSPNKLKQGFGEHVTYLLDKLSERALKMSNYTWQSVNSTELERGNEGQDSGGEEDGGEDEEGEEDLEEDQGVPEMMEYSSGSDGENVMDRRYQEDVLENNNSSFRWDSGAEWWNEVERVAPTLRIRIAPSARDWRQHTQQLSQHRLELSKQSSSVGDALSRCVSRAVMHIEACNSRQSLLQERAAAKLERLATLVKQTSMASDNYKAISGSVTQRQEILSELSEKVEAVRQKTELKGSAMNDQSPVVNIRRYMGQLRRELQEMDVQLAVLMWCMQEHYSGGKKTTI